MPFIGKQPETGAFKLIDSITTSATATYALTVNSAAYFPESARNLIVSLNGVTQAPESAYTVSGSNIVFASALTASDVIDYILVIGDAVDIGTPSDNTVGTDQIASSVDLSGKTLTFANDQISGNVIDGGTISNFASTGIDDNATSTAITISSSGTLTHNGPDSSWYSNSSANNTRLDLIPTNGSVTYRAFAAGTDSTPSHVWNTQGSTHMTLNSSGNLGIGTASPANKLDVNGILQSSSIGNYLQIQQSSTEGYINMTGSGGLNFRMGSGFDTRMTITSSGNVGIGTTSPSSQLHVQASGGSTGIIQLGTTGGTVAREWKLLTPSSNGYLYIQDVNASSNRVAIDTSGNVGIGTTSPTNPLTVQANSGAGAAALNGRSSDGIATLGFYASNGTTAQGYVQGRSDSLRLWAASGDYLSLGSSDTERMRIDSSGNVGIGTTTTSGFGTGGALRLGTNTNGWSLVLNSSANGNSGLLHFVDQTGSNAFQIGGGTSQNYFYGYGNRYLSFFTNDTERMRIDSSGRVGIGRTPTDVALEVAGAAYTGFDGPANVFLYGDRNYNDTGNAGSGILFGGEYTSAGSLTTFALISGIKENTNNTDSAGALTFQTRPNGSVPVERMRITSSGNLLVGVTASSIKFHVLDSTANAVALVQNTSSATSGVGGVYSSLNSTANNTNCFHFKGTTQGVASYYLYGNGTSSFTSDERQKKNIVNTKDGYLDDLKRLRVVDYHWNSQEDTEDKSVGLIAQEVEQVFPHLVIEHELEGAGLRKNLLGSEFTFILIKAIQEQQAMIEELKAEVAALKGA